MGIGAKMDECDKTKMNWIVYILECSDNTLYTGITKDIERRMAEHENGTGAKYTKGRGPFNIYLRAAIYFGISHIKLEKI